MLAYSSVAQAGYMMIGLVVAGSAAEAIGATLYYVIVYCAMTIGAFAVLSAIGPDADSIDDLKGLGKRSPFLAVCMTLFFLALAGLPPSLAGLMGKVYLFSSALSAEFFGLAINFHTANGSSLQSGMNELTNGIIFFNVQSKIRRTRKPVALPAVYHLKAN
jgi:NADH-quinone oxidoreductase subunit N